jgi:hypothetical protein
MAYTEILETTEFVVGTVVIAESASLSDAFPSAGRRLVIVQQPAMDSAVLTFQVKLHANGDFVDLYNDDGTEVSTAVASAAAQAFIIPQLAACNAFKVRSGTAASPVNQSAAETLTISASGGKLG